jgi:NAD(P)-dependent dehydrogenase (short-subunit alcohol dehydrogenase family)
LATSDYRDPDLSLARASDEISSCFACCIPGTFGPGKELEHSEVDDMTDVLNINVLGPMLCSRELIRRQSIKNGGQGGAIVNISSGAAYQCSPTTPLYSVSKGAVNSLNHALAGGLNFEDHGIRANAVSPGLTNTDMVANVDFSRVTSTLPARRVGDPQEIANTVVFLLDDELSSYTHGANIRVAGGRL